MHIAGVELDRAGATDRALAGLAARLSAGGLQISGALQAPRSGRDEMAVLLLPRHERLGISQSLGAGAGGCTLDPDALARAVAQIETEFRTRRPDLLLLNRFGREEAAGRGLRGVIAEAAQAGVPVLVAVAPDYAADFAAFTGGLAATLPNRPEALDAWWRSVAASV